MQSHNITIHPGDIVAVLEGVLLVSTWAWALRTKQARSGWREKSAFWALVCATAAVLADLGLTVVMHFRGESTFAAISFAATLIGSLLLGSAGLVLGFLGRGSPRLAGLVWSCVTLAMVASSVVMAAAH